MLAWQMPKSGRLFKKRTYQSGCVKTSIYKKPQFSLNLLIPADRTSHFSLWGTTERVGFEPTVACTTSAFEADALDHYATSPYKHMQWSILHDSGIPSEGFEPPTLPLGRACSVQLS